MSLLPSIVIMVLSHATQKDKSTGTEGVSLFTERAFGICTPSGMFGDEAREKEGGDFDLVESSLLHRRDFQVMIDGLSSHVRIGIVKCHHESSRGFHTFKNARLYSFRNQSLLGYNRYVLFDRNKLDFKIDVFVNGSAIPLNSLSNFNFNLFLDPSSSWNPVFIVFSFEILMNWLKIFSPKFYRKLFWRNVRKLLLFWCFSAFWRTTEESWYCSGVDLISKCFVFRWAYNCT